ncbi:aminoglycoside N(3)-acetyltransferase [Planomonospora venezuelensis]|uniref:Aminoglycoside N(3)-acetyltransferase n=1 Tax=Planomonospora venezuelensis TaxID=1999 RepID=A0A841D781_PLAVE|nr:AAC(3) family N-acetyltransferase [Planomonospora venezuelensis]MBB5964208.1 aminoglycoside 3-N-acetyltransferase [Planomonospora venezuelensis]GIN04382.1 AAC(3) family N-acetyltransferase [Planomonospora venezuelensis]
MGLSTIGDLVTGLRSLGVAEGDVLLVHCSLSRLGHVAGGAGAVVLALREAVGEGGTLVVPAQSWQLCDPAYLADPAVPEAWWETIRSATPPYDPAWTPSRSMGAVAEALRTMPGARRSGHPHRSFAAWGRHAAAVTARHDLDDPVGEGSPLSAVHDLDGRVLLLGVGHEKNTSLHLAEARTGLPRERVPNGAPLLIGGERRWVRFTEPAVDDADFAAAGAAFAGTGGVRQGAIGAATALLMSQRDLVGFAAPWFRAHRTVR